MNKTRIALPRMLRLAPLAVLMFSPLASGLTLEQAVSQAVNSDAWIDGSHHRQAAHQALGEAAGRLPDPTFSFALSGLPVDTFDLDQEPMTQLVAGASQTIPRGDTLALSRNRFEQEADREPLLRADRRAQVRLQVSQLWLDAWKAQRSIELIENNRALFEQLGEVAAASYVSAYGRTRQQDLVRAELELTQIDDRLTALQQRYETALTGLSRWVERADAGVEPEGESLQAADLMKGRLQGSDADLAAHFVHHPSIAVIDARLSVSETDIDLAKQKYRPQWGLSAQYGVRVGERPDLVGVGLSVNMPLFSTVRQDSEVAAAASQREALKTERALRLRQLMADYRSALAAFDRLEGRLSLYRDRLLPQARQAAQAALTAYRADDGDFAEVVRARIAELNARLSIVELTAEQHKQATQLNYLTTHLDAEDA